MAASNKWLIILITHRKNESSFPHQFMLFGTQHPVFFTCDEVIMFHFPMNRTSACFILGAEASGGANRFKPTLWTGGRRQSTESRPAMTISGSPALPQAE
jgi:hypothetical protein